MFTGIVEEIGRIKSAGPRGLVVAAPLVAAGTRRGDSIAVNGVCLTVTEMADTVLSFDTMPETLRRSNLGGLRPGDWVNLERALGVGDRLGGHFVQGHIDGTGRVISLAAEGEAVLMRAAALPEIMRYLVEKGFIAVDGVSLTVASLDAASFSVSLVAYTRRNTTLGGLKPGNRVNLEVDILAKYLERFGEGSKRGITIDFLVEHGFTDSRVRGGP